MEEKLSELEFKMTEDGFWNDQDLSSKIMKEVKIIKEKIQKYNDLVSDYDEACVLHEMAMEEKDPELLEEINSFIIKVSSSIEKMKLELLLSGEYDKNNCILSIHAGTGGLDAQDWAEMLMRMYLRWSDKNGYSTKILDILRDTEAGIKSVSIGIEGINAYGFLKSEKGVHRLVRISPFDSSGKRHTSFASVDIMPELDDDIEVDINPNDLKIDTYRASGAGGQHVNKTDSAVRITHIPTGVTVQCQNERSQHSNKATAMKILMGKLFDLKELEHKDKIEDLMGDYSQIAWGSQIRSYVFNPYNLVKDHRTNAEIGNVQAVMDGDIDLFIDEYLKMNM